MELRTDGMSLDIVMRRPKPVYPALPDAKPTAAKPEPEATSTALLSQPFPTLAASPPPPSSANAPTPPVLMSPPAQASQVPQPSALDSACPLPPSEVSPSCVGRRTLQVLHCALCPAAPRTRRAQLAPAKHRHITAPMIEQTVLPAGCTQPNPLILNNTSHSSCTHRGRPGCSTSSCWRECGHSLPSAS